MRFGAKSGRREKKKGGGDIGARWEGSLANHPSHSPPPIALHIKLSFNPASSLSRNLGFNRAGAPRASTIALNLLELELDWTDTGSSSQASSIQVNIQSLD